MKNRIHDYEAGWLTLLVKMGIATEESAKEAMYRVAQDAIDEIERRRKLKKKGRRRRDSE